MADLNFRVVLDNDAIAKLSGGDDIIRALEVAGGIGELSAKEHAPVDTGNLRRSITHEVTVRGDNPFVRIGTNVEYGLFQEVGTVHHPAHPFLRPAMEAIRRAIK